MKKMSETEWVARKVRELLRSCGPKTAHRFLDSRGGPSRHESASREIARHVLAAKKAQALSEKATSPLYQVLKMV